MARVTLRLPEDLHARLRSAAERSGTSLNQLMIAALTEGLERQAPSPKSGDSLREQVAYLRRALGSLAVDLSTGLLPPHLQPGRDYPDSDTLRSSMPELDPPLSTTIIADRVDRF